ncbi:MAG: hypothetical protein M1570_01070 [Chloroflexi bacterium]|nr:hypothetical protein [Chloroflexota bacterium]
MPCFGAAPLLLIVLVGLAIGLIVWGMVRMRENSAGNSLAGPRDDLLIGGLVLAAFSAGVFAAFILLGFAGC